MKELSFTHSLVNRYYHEKLMRDIRNYFVLSGDKEVTCLHLRGENPFNGYPGVYGGAGPWWCTEHNYVFSGMFFYIYVVQKSIRKVCGDDNDICFCRVLDWPIFHDIQPVEDFNPIASLREASLAPLKPEKDNYVAMLNVVVPYMEDITKGNIDIITDKVKQEIYRHIKAMYDWVNNLSDERVYYYGLPLRKVYNPDNGNYTHLYYIENTSLGEFSEQYQVYSYDDFVMKNVPSSHPESDITELDAPIVPHYDDLKYAEELDRFLDEGSEYHEFTEDKRKKNTLLNMMLNMEWSDTTYHQEDKVGLKDCWGRIVVPAKYDDCIGCWDFQYLFSGRFCAAFQTSGKWGFILRNNPNKIIVEPIFDDVRPALGGAFVVKRNNRFGLYSRAGRELLPPDMDDIFRPGFHGSILYVKEGKYGIMLENGRITRDLFDEVDFDSGHYLFVRLGDTWGYVSENGDFVTGRSKAWLLSTELYSRDSLISDLFPDDTEIEEEEKKSEEYCTLDSMKKSLERLSHQLGSVESSSIGTGIVGIGVFKPVLYLEFNKPRLTFCVDFKRPYQMRLLDDRFHDMIQSWEGYETEKRILATWLNAKNEKTGVRNWAEAFYNYYLNRDENEQFKIFYARRKVLDFGTIDEDGFEEFNYPEIVFD